MKNNNGCPIELLRQLKEQEHLGHLGRIHRADVALQRLQASARRCTLPGKSTRPQNGVRPQTSE